jgi:hypothetical protein
MRRCSGTAIKRNDDEWYTTPATAARVAAWLAARVSLSTPIACPSDFEHCAIPDALRLAGFTDIESFSDLPVREIPWIDRCYGKLIVTNPPFSLLVPFRRYLAVHKGGFFVMARPGTLTVGRPVPELTLCQHCTRAGVRSGVAAAWFTDIPFTAPPPDPSKALGDCAICESKCRWAGTPRPLYGWGAAVRYGLSGFCDKYTLKGKRSFTRFFDPATLAAERQPEAAP